MLDHRWTYVWAREPHTVRAPHLLSEIWDCLEGKAKIWKTDSRLTGAAHFFTFEENSWGCPAQKNLGRGKTKGFLDPLKFPGLSIRQHIRECVDECSLIWLKTQMNKWTKVTRVYKIMFGIRPVGCGLAPGEEQIHRVGNIYMLCTTVYWMKSLPKIPYLFYTTPVK